MDDLAGSRTTLLMHPEPQALRSLREDLTRMGHRVLWARDGWDATQILNRYRGRLDLIITDVAAPGLSGPALMHRAALRHPEAKVIYISGLGHELVRSYGIEPDQVRLLWQPYDATDLRRTVQEALGETPDGVAEELGE